MTCIVGVVQNGEVWMGGDSAGVSDWVTRVRADSKVFQRGPFLMGFTTSFRMGQLLRYSLVVPAQGKKQTDHEYLATSFVNEVRACLKEGGFAKTESSREEGGDFLVAYKGSLYNVCSDYQVAAAVDPFDTVGCGREFALGALHAMPRATPPRKRVEVALEAAARFSSGVVGPFQILKAKQ